MILLPSRFFRLSRLAGAIFFLSSSMPGRSSRARISPFSNQRSRFAELQYITSTTSHALAGVLLVVEVGVVFHGVRLEHPAREVQRLVRARASPRPVGQPRSGSQQS